MTVEWAGYKSNCLENREIKKGKFRIPQEFLMVSNINLQTFQIPSTPRVNSQKQVYIYIAHFGSRHE